MTSGLSDTDTGTGIRAGDVAAAILARGAGEAVVVPGCARPAPRAAVVAAVDDDGNPGPVVRYAAAEARRRSVPLRVVHVWGERGTARDAHDAMCDADRLLSAVLYDHLGDSDAAAAEREILHDDDPARALCALSADASLLVVAAGHGAAPLGHTARALIGVTRCPLAVLPPASTGFVQKGAPTQEER
ncbi:universal stress protein [Actinoplanes sp. NPDC049681]|uniref:universal stress protein n=1 Tax=Actinoplanes sp. NPDC049681 TaxID=3363905 RepID=UPI003793C134